MGETNITINFDAAKLDALEFVLRKQRSYVFSVSAGEGLVGDGAADCSATFWAQYGHGSLLIIFPHFEQRHLWYDIVFAPALAVSLQGFSLWHSLQSEVSFSGIQFLITSFTVNVSPEISLFSILYLSTSSGTRFASPSFSIYQIISSSSCSNSDKSPFPLFVFLNYVFTYAFPKRLKNSTLC